MTPENTLIELLERVGANRGATVFINNHELNTWPSATVELMKSQGLITKAGTVTSTVCLGCERECVMPVHVIPGKAYEAGVVFVVCDKRTDINRVSVTINRLEQWQISGLLIANLLAGLLGTSPSATNNANTARWEVGMLKGAKHSSHIVLIADGNLYLSLAGHSIPLVDVLTFKGNTFKVDRLKLCHAVDQPATGAGDVESATQRRNRLKKRVDTLRTSGVKAFLKTVAEEEGITTSRLKQILYRKNNTKSKSNW